MRSCPLAIPGETLEIRYTFPDEPREKVHFIVCDLNDKRCFPEPKAAEQIDERTFRLRTFVPESLTPGVYRLTLVGQGPGLVARDLFFAVAPRVEEQDIEKGGIRLCVSNEVNPDFSW